MCASAAAVASRSRSGPGTRARRLPAVVSLALVLLGLIAVATRLDAASDGTLIRAGWSSWRSDGVVVDARGAAGPSEIRDGDAVTRISGHRLADGLGGIPRPEPGEAVDYEVIREAPVELTVRVVRPHWAPLAAAGWGNLVFVLALGSLALALYVRRPNEPATPPLLIAAAGLLGSTLSIVAGLPALALATGGPVLWLFHLSVVGAYSVAWGAVLAFSLLMGRDRRRSPRVLGVAYAAPLALMLLWAAGTAALVRSPLRWLGLVHAGQTVVVMATLATGTALGVAAYRRSRDPLTRSRLRWLAGGGVAAGLLSALGWHLPELITGRPLLPAGALGLAALPFVVGIAVALRRHRLFDIERLANRSLVYLGVVTVLAAGYAAVVALLVSGLRVSGAVAAAAAAAVAALALAPLRSAAQRTVNRLMYGDRDDPAAVLSRLGDRLQAVISPADVFPAVADTVAQSLRLPYAAVDLADPAGGFRTVAEHGAPVGAVHVEPITRHNLPVGRLRVSERGRDDPLAPADLELIGSLARQVAPAIEAVRLQEDLRRSRAQVVALREDERRRLRRDLHDGLGPVLAAIGLQAGLAAREVAPDSAVGRLLGEIDAEVTASLAEVRRLVEALRPPALDELGLVGALRSRAASLAGGLRIEVSGSVGPQSLPAAVETAAYWITVEAMTNAVRHSGGSRCAVTIQASDHELEVTVSDDGRGLDEAHRPGVGLRSMRERAAEVGGAVAVRTGSTGGTVVSARLPLTLGGPLGQSDPR